MGEELNDIRVGVLIFLEKTGFSRNPGIKEQSVDSSVCKNTFELNKCIISIN